MVLGHFPPALSAPKLPEYTCLLRAPPRMRVARRRGRTALGLGADKAAERLACMVCGGWAWGCDGGGGGGGDVAVVGDDVAVDMSVDMFVDGSVGVDAVAVVVVRILGEGLA